MNGESNMNRKLVFVLIVIIAVLSIPAYVGIRAFTYSNPYKDRKEKLQADFSSFPAYPGTTCIENKNSGEGGGQMSAPPFCKRIKLLYGHRIVLDVTSLAPDQMDLLKIHDFYYECLKSAGLNLGGFSYVSGDSPGLNPRNDLHGRDTIIIIENFGAKKDGKDLLHLFFFVYVDNVTEPTK